MTRRSWPGHPRRMDSWRVRTTSPSDLVGPRPVDPEGRAGPTKSQASGRLWRRTSPGLYVPAATDRTVVEQRILEESCRLPPSGAVSGWAALRFHGVGFTDGKAADLTELPVPLVVPPGVSLRPAPGIELHRERIESHEVVTRHGVRVAAPYRAAFDAARWQSGLRERVSVLDRALAAGAIVRATFQEYLWSRAGGSGVRQVQRAFDLADGRSMSPPETALRMIWILDAGLPAPKCNWPVADADGRFIGRPDLLSEELALVGEFDGAHHRSRNRQRDDLRRDDAFRAVGLETFRIVGADLADVPLVLNRIAGSIRRAQSSNVPRAWMTGARPAAV